MVSTRVRKEAANPKPVVWMGSSRRDLKTFPEEVQAHVGYALYGAQCGEEYASVKAMIRQRLADAERLHATRRK